MFGDPRVIDPLIARLQTADSTTIYSVTTALSAFAEPRVIDALARAGKQETKLNAVLAALRRIGAPGLPALFSLLCDPNVSQRQNVAYQISALFNVKDRALSPLPEPIHAALVTALQDENDVVRTIAIAVLTKMGDPRGVEVLLPVLRDPTDDRFVYMLWMINLITDPQEMDTLLGVLAQPDLARDTRTQVIQGITQIIIANPHADYTRLVAPLLLAVAQSLLAHSRTDV